jgi:hypothetical protein
MSEKPKLNRKRSRDEYESSSGSDSDSDSDSDSEYESGSDSEDEGVVYKKFMVLVSVVLHGGGYKFEKKNDQCIRSVIDDAFTTISDNEISDNINIIRNTIPFHVYMSTEDIHEVVDNYMFYLRDYSKLMRKSDETLIHYENKKIKYTRGKKKLPKIEHVYQEKDRSPYSSPEKVFYLVSQKFHKNEVFFNEILQTELMKRKFDEDPEFWIKVSVFGKQDGLDIWEEIDAKKEKYKLLSKREKGGLFDEFKGEKEITLKNFMIKFQPIIKNHANQYMTSLLGSDEYNHFDINNIEEYKYVFHTCSPPNVMTKDMKNQGIRQGPRLSQGQLCRLNWQTVFLNMLIYAGRIFVYHKGLDNRSKDYTKQRADTIDVVNRDHLNTGNLNIMDYDDRKELYITMTEFMKHIFIFQKTFNEEEDDNGFIKTNMNSFKNKFPLFKNYEPIHIFKYILHQVTNLPYDNEKPQGVMSSYVGDGKGSIPDTRDKFPIVINIKNIAENFGSTVTHFSKDGHGILSTKREGLGRKKTLTHISNYISNLLDYNKYPVYDKSKSRFENHLNLIEEMGKQDNLDIENFVKGGKKLKRRKTKRKRRRKKTRKKKDRKKHKKTQRKRLRRLRKKRKKTQKYYKY